MNVNYYSLLITSLGYILGILMLCVKQLLLLMLKEGSRIQIPRILIGLLFQVFS